jgi:hypothetical protein
MLRTAIPSLSFRAGPVLLPPSHGREGKRQSARGRGTKRRSLLQQEEQSLYVVCPWPKLNSTWKRTGHRCLGLQLPGSSREARPAARPKTHREWSYSLSLLVPQVPLTPFLWGPHVTRTAPLLDWPHLSLAYGIVPVSYSLFPKPAYRA